MKLIDKKDIIVQKSTERKRDIDEGMKLAKSIDVLRETHGKEQISLKQFRDQTLASIKSELDVLLEQKKETLNEIEQLEKRRREALAPIDLTNEWNQVEKDKQSLLQRETGLINREILVQDVDKREQLVSKKEKEAQLYFDEARTTYQKTEKILNEIETRNKESQSLIEEKVLVLDKREKDLVERESVTNKQLEQVSRDKNEILVKGTELIERESRVESQTKVLFNREEKVKELEALTKRFNDEATRNYDVSENVKFETNKFKEESEKDIHTRYVALQEREKEIGYRERDLTLEREKVENDKKEIEKEKIHIASQQQTLKTAWENIKRLQK